MSNEPTVTNLPGGNARVQFGAPAPDAPVSNGDILRGGVSDGGAFRMNGDGTVEQFGGVTRHVQNSDRDLTSDNILDTVRTASGARPVKLEGHHRVTVSGMEMTVDNAMRLGYLRQIGEYKFEETGQHRADRERVTQAYEAQHMGDDQGNARSPATARPTLGSSLKIG